MSRYITRGLLMLALCVAGRGASAEEAAPVPRLNIDREVGAARELGLEAGQNRLLVLSQPIGRVSVAEPSVADLKVITPTQLLLTARGVGTTDLTLWTKNDEPLVIALHVTRNLEALRRQLKELFPNEKVIVNAVGDLVVLSGSVSDMRLPERIAELAQLHAGKVANLVQVAGDQQVQLEVKFAEVSRSGLKEMGINFFHKSTDGKRVGGVASSRTTAGDFMDRPPPKYMPGAGDQGLLPGKQPPDMYVQPFGDAFSVFFSGYSRFPFSAILSVLEQSGLAKTLAEPTLVTLSGQQAKFLAGGEFPVPLASALGQVNVEWKKFGIILQFTPTVIASDTVHLKMAAEVSDLDQSAGIAIAGFTIPGLSSRQSETTVRLGDGQSFAIAGLLSDKMRSEIDKIPFLGSIPVLGALFRSTEWRRDETELLVVITARLVHPLAPHEVPPLPGAGEDSDPGFFQLFFLGDSGIEPTLTGARKERRGPSGDVGYIR